MCCEEGVITCGGEGEGGHCRHRTKSTLIIHQIRNYYSKIYYSSQQRCALSLNMYAVIGKSFEKGTCDYILQSLM